MDAQKDDAIFPDVVSSDIGIDLSQAPTGGAFGVGSMSAVVLRHAEVVLRISDGREHRECCNDLGATPPFPRRSELAGGHALV